MDDRIPLPFNLELNLCKKKLYNQILLTLKKQAKLSKDDIDFIEDLNCLMKENSTNVVKKLKQTKKLSKKQKTMKDCIQDMSSLDLDQKDHAYESEKTIQDMSSLDLDQKDHASESEKTIQDMSSLDLDQKDHASESEDHGIKKKKQKNMRDSMKDILSYNVEENDIYHKENESDDDEDMYLIF